MALALLLRLVQHDAYGHGPHMIVSRACFLQEVTAASDLRRFPALCSLWCSRGDWLVVALSFWSPLLLSAVGHSRVSCGFS